MGQTTKARRRAHPVLLQALSAFRRAFPSRQASLSISAMRDSTAFKRVPENRPSSSIWTHEACARILDPDRLAVERGSIRYVERDRRGIAYLDVFRQTRIVRVPNSNIVSRCPDSRFALLDARVAGSATAARLIVPDEFHRQTRRSPTRAVCKCELPKRRSPDGTDDMDIRSCVRGRVGRVHILHRADGLSRAATGGPYANPSRPILLPFLHGQTTVS